ncbi:MAG: carbohydrate ABC transporter permease [Chloroflexota bacterium]
MATGDTTQVEPGALAASAGALTRLRRRRSTVRYKRDEVIMGYLFILIPMIIFVTFFLGAMVFDFWISFFHWAILDSPRLVGSANYDYIFRRDPTFWIAIGNTVEYAIVVVPIQTFIAFMLALVVNQNIRGRTFFRTAFYFPSITSSVAISVIFLYLFNNFGLLNTLLSDIHVQGPNWLGDPHVALKSIMGLNIWTTTGTLMVIFLAALQDVPRDVLEAAAIDGANGFQAVVRVVIPLIRPALFFVVANGIIGTLQIFDQAFLLSQGTGGPENSTLTAVLYIYNNAFQNHFYGVAAAASFFLFAFIFAATLVVRRFIGEEAA